MGNPSPDLAPQPGAREQRLRREFRPAGRQAEFAPGPSLAKAPPFSVLVLFPPQIFAGEGGSWAPTGAKGPDSVRSRFGDWMALKRPLFQPLGFAPRRNKKKHKLSLKQAPRLKFQKTGLEFWGSKPWNSRVLRFQTLEKALNPETRSLSLSLLLFSASSLLPPACRVFGPVPLAPTLCTVENAQCPVQGSALGQG